MPSTQHAQPPADDPPPPEGRRDHETPTAGDTGPMTAEQRALRDAWLAELWPVCPEAGRTRPKRRRTAA